MLIIVERLVFLSNFHISTNFLGNYITFALGITEMKSKLLKIGLKR